MPLVRPHPPSPKLAADTRGYHFADGGPHFLWEPGGGDSCGYASWPMADQYRIRAAEFHAKAQDAADPKLRAQFENLSLAYLAWRNRPTGTVRLN